MSVDGHLRSPSSQARLSVWDELASDRGPGWAHYHLTPVCSLANRPCDAPGQFTRCPFALAMTFAPPVLQWCTAKAHPCLADRRRLRVGHRRRDDPSAGHAQDPRSSAAGIRGRWWLPQPLPWRTGGWAGGSAGWRRLLRHVRVLQVCPHERPQLTLVA